ncbi:MAG: RNA binding methyltransferase FtsJ like [Brockia lithotrophica]|uniref:RNA binding methyltransferase FtsJ like n=1 Tax=Brockia lithotrophica TaxID=933949 RepID=A0A2T5G673_9BACL|nr:TlyA family RNA methyltransferase [Brockia lithotrophica]PTQ51674.1 MAG: RNA binding methyltransferase FtsJ like [Brockia lithotrophica]
MVRKEKDGEGSGARKRVRLDVLLSERGFFPSREAARSAVLAGEVFVDGKRVEKPGTFVSPDASLEVRTRGARYVSRGGYKLEAAVRAFGLDFRDKVVLDVGASTGGFTDCALRHGAARVYALDVGYGQLAWSLRQDPRVVPIEKTNFRTFSPEDLPGPLPDVVTIDVSFISLRLLFPNLARFLAPEKELVALVKPQFEAGRRDVGKGGIVRDPEVHRRVLREVLLSAREHGFQPLGLIPSPIRGKDGNLEFLLYARRLPSRATPSEHEPTDAVEVLIENALHSPAPPEGSLPPHS